jgi:hypothetical protein
MKEAITIQSANDMISENAIYQLKAEKNFKVFKSVNSKYKKHSWRNG